MGSHYIQAFLLSLLFLGPSLQLMWPFQFALCHLGITLPFKAAFKD